jgi:hypothetical protein
MKAHGDPAGLLELVEDGIPAEKEISAVYENSEFTHG